MSFTPQLLFEDNHLLAVEKPINLLSQADHSGSSDLLSLLKDWIKQRDQKPGQVFLGLVQRLDRPVGGVMVFAKILRRTQVHSHIVPFHVACAHLTQRQMWSPVAFGSPKSWFLIQLFTMTSRTLKLNGFASALHTGLPVQHGGPVMQTTAFSPT